jgi:hypothetical protein
MMQKGTADSAPLPFNDPPVRMFEEIFIPALRVRFVHRGVDLFICTHHTSKFTVDAVALALGDVGFLGRAQPHICPNKDWRGLGIISCHGGIHEKAAFGNVNYVPL